MTTNVTDLVLEPDVFADLSDLAKRESGLLLGAEKRTMVQSRLKARLRALNMTDFKQYSHLVRSNGGARELRQMISALTTNVSHFFRENHHFDLLTEELGHVLKEKARTGERIRIWSAGCSTGQEPYSIAMHFLTNISELWDADFRILATDIDPKVLETGLRGRYYKRETPNIPEDLLEKFFIESDLSDCLEVSDSLRNVVAFRELNLLKSWPMKYLFDAVFCRNVVIYFDGATQNLLWPRFVDTLHPHGILFLGHSERISDPEKMGLTPIGHTAYKQSQSKSRLTAHS